MFMRLFRLAIGGGTATIPIAITIITVIGLAVTAAWHAWDSEKITLQNQGAQQCVDAAHSAEVAQLRANYQSLLAQLVNERAANAQAALEVKARDAQVSTERAQIASNQGVDGTVPDAALEIVNKPLRGH